MTHWIVMDIVQCGPAVGCVTNLAVRDAMLDMAASLVVFAVPGEGGSSVELAQIGQRLLQVRCFEIEVVVRHHA